jgi:hypothetical protein
VPTLGGWHRGPQTWHLAPPPPPPGPPPQIPDPHLVAVLVAQHLVEHGGAHGQRGQAVVGGDDGHLILGVLDVRAHGAADEAVRVHDNHGGAVGQRLARGNGGGMRGRVTI